MSFERLGCGALTGHGSRWQARRREHTACCDPQEASKRPQLRCPRRRWGKRNGAKAYCEPGLGHSRQVGYLLSSACVIANTYQESRQQDVQSILSPLGCSEDRRGSFLDYPDSSPALQLLASYPIDDVLQKVLCYQGTPRHGVIRLHQACQREWFGRCNRTSYEPQASLRSHRPDSFPDARGNPHVRHSAHHRSEWCRTRRSRSIKAADRRQKQGANHSCLHNCWDLDGVKREYRN